MRSSRKARYRSRNACRKRHRCRQLRLDQSHLEVRPRLESPEDPVARLPCRAGFALRSLRPSSSRSPRLAFRSLLTLLSLSTSGSGCASFPTLTPRPLFAGLALRPLRTRGSRISFIALRAFGNVGSRRTVLVGDGDCRPVGRLRHRCNWAEPVNAVLPVGPVEVSAFGSCNKALPGSVLANPSISTIDDSRRWPFPSRNHPATETAVTPTFGTRSH